MFGGGGGSGGGGGGGAGAGAGSSGGSGGAGGGVWLSSILISYFAHFSLSPFLPFFSQQQQ